MCTRYLCVVGACLAWLLVANVEARGPKVSQNGNLHNLSAKNTAVYYRAVDNTATNPKGQQICIFCHTPHNAVGQAQLWNRKDTTQNFERYSSATLGIKDIAASQYAGSQPNGASRLCLSCHDGVTGLGDVIWGGPIQMQNGDTIASSRISSFHPSTSKMKLGHHPVSFVYALGFNYNTQSGTMIGLDSGKFQLPISASPMQSYVKLQDSLRDGRGWMQCTTCHDPHQNMGNDTETYPVTTRKIVPFWVYSTNGAASNSHDAVCNSCHKLAQTPVPWPWP